MTNEPEQPKTKKRKSLKKRFAALFADKPRLFVIVLVLALAVVVCWPFFTTTVEAGYVGVYFSRFFGGTLQNVYCNEGVRFVFPWDAIIPYDARSQSRDYSVTALAKGGLAVNVEMTVIWRIKRDRVGELHTTLGGDYANNVIDPAVTSVVRSIIGQYEQSRLYDGNPLLLQEEVMQLLNETLSDAPFQFTVILVRSVELPEAMSSAISDKFVAEQNVLAERYRVLEAVEKYKRNYVDSESVRFSQALVNEGMTEAYLRFIGIQATLELAQSSNAKLVIIGDKDGLPLMLNTDTWSTSDSIPESTLSLDDYFEDKDHEPVRKNTFMAIYERMQETLAEMDSVGAALLANFPEASEGIGDTMLPQTNNVPTTNKGGNE